MDWNSAGGAATIGGLIGAGVATAGNILLELWLKPAYGRKRVATVLLAEMELSVRLLDGAIAHRKNNPDSVSDLTQLPQRGWDAVADELHYLPKDVLASSMLVYGQFGEINAVARNYAAKVDRFLTLTPDVNSPVHALYNELQNDSHLFGIVLRSARKGCLHLIPLLRELRDNGPPTRD